MQQRARDLDPPHLTARQFAHDIPGAVGEFDLVQRRERASPCLATADAMQRGVI